MPDLYAGVEAALRQLIDAQAFRVVLRDDSGAVSCPYFAGNAGADTPVPMTDEWTDHVLESSEPTVAGDPAGSWLGVPLAADGRTIGALVVQARPGRAPYGAREQEILGFVARQVLAGLERKRAEEELKRTVAVLRSTLDSTADGILVVDHGGRVVSFNERFAHLWRIPRPMLSMRDDVALIAHVLDQLEDPQQFLSKVQELYSRPEAEAFDELAFKDGRIFERYSIPLRQGGRPTGRVWCFRDVTRSRDLERRVRRSDKLEAVRKLAGAAAQDFSNLLTVITSRSELARRGMAADETRRHLDEILSAAERAKDLTLQLFAFSRGRPLSPPGATLPSAPSAEEAPRGSETVLLVEHHEAVRQVAHEILEAQGYAVLEAGHGAEALAIQERHGHPIQLTITEVALPDMTGPELARRVVRSWPDAKTLFVSGEADAHPAPDELLVRDAAFLAKPFAPDALARKVREVLDAAVVR
jgi:CheY-like chemotaxis protein